MTALILATVLSQPPVYGAPVRVPTRIEQREARSGDDSVRWLQIPPDGIRAAASDIVTLPIVDRRYQRYFWFRDSQDAEYKRAYQVAMNMAVNRSATIQRLFAVGGHLLRMDTREWLPAATKVEKELGIDDADTNFDKVLAKHNDPHFYARAGELVTIVALDGCGFYQSGQRTTTVNIPAGTRLVITARQDGGGVTWCQVEHGGQIGYVKEERITQRREKGDGIVFSPAVLNNARSLVAANILAEETHTINADGTLRTLPIVEADTFLAFALDAFQGDYYGLRGYRKENGELLSLAEVWRVHGADVAASEALKGTEFIGLSPSSITGGPRRVLNFIVLAARLSKSTGLASVTQDQNANRIALGISPIYNLFPGGFKFDASEIIITLPNGLQVYLLANSAGELLTAADAETVTDDTVPDPLPEILRPGISCIRCHIVSGDGGWKPANNDVADMFSSDVGGRVAILLDDVGEAAKGLEPDEIRQQFLEKYSGDAEVIYRRAREDVEVACRSITRGVDGVGMTAQEATDAFASRYNLHVSALTPRVACRELGIETPDDETAIRYLQRLLPPAVAVGGLSPEDPTVIRLLRYDERVASNRVVRDVWQEIVATLQDRAIRTGDWTIETKESDQ